MDVETDNPEVARISVAAEFTKLLLEALPSNRKTEYKKKFIIETFNTIYQGLTKPAKPKTAK